MTTSCLTRSPNDTGWCAASKVSIAVTGTRRHAVPEPVAIANGVIFALATGENTMQASGPDVITYHGQKLLTDTQRGENTHNAVLRALDAKTGQVLYDSGDAMGSWVHFSGLAIADGRVYAVDHNSTLYCFGLAEH